jgi:hypothetical protein
VLPSPRGRRAQGRAERGHSEPTPRLEPETPSVCSTERVVAVGASVPRKIPLALSRRRGNRADRSRSSGVSLGWTARAGWRAQYRDDRATSAVQPTAQQISQAKIAYAKLNAAAKRELRRLTTGYAKLLNRAMSCAQHVTVRCAVVIQVAVKIVATLGNTASRMTHELTQLIQSFVPRPNRASGSRLSSSARPISGAPA